MFGLRRQAIRLNIPAVLLIIMSVALNGVKNANQGKCGVFFIDRPIERPTFWRASSSTQHAADRSDQAWPSQEHHKRGLERVSDYCQCIYVLNPIYLSASY